MQVATDVRLVVAQHRVRQMCNTEIAMAHRCSITVLPVFVVTTEDGLHAAHVDVRPRQIHMGRAAILICSLGLNPGICTDEFGANTTDQK